MAEESLDRLLLRVIGLDREKHLRSMGAENDGMPEKELKSSNVRLSSTTFEGLSCEEAEDDPIEITESTQAGIGIYTCEAIQEVVLKSAEDATQTECQFRVSNH